MVAAAIHSVTIVLWKETAFPLCLDRRNGVERVPAFTPATAAAAGAIAPCRRCVCEIQRQLELAGRRKIVCRQPQAASDILHGRQVCVYWRSPIVPACTQWSACISSGRPFRTPRDFPGLHSTTTTSFCSSESRWRGWCRRTEIRCLGLSGIFRYGRISSNSFDDMLRKSTAYIFTDALLEIDIR